MPIFYLLKNKECVVFKNKEWNLNRSSKSRKWMPNWPGLEELIDGLDFGLWHWHATVAIHSHIDSKKTQLYMYTCVVNCFQSEWLPCLSCNQVLESLFTLPFLNLFGRGGVVIVPPCSGPLLLVSLLNHPNPTSVDRELTQTVGLLSLLSK